MVKEWYAVHTQSGREYKVKEFIENKIAADSNVSQWLFQVRVPTEEYIEMKDGKRKSARRKYFPGYVLVEMEMNDTNYLWIKRVPGITNIVSQGRTPKPLNPEEIKNLFHQIEDKKVQEKTKPKFAFNIEEQVKIIDGPFKNFIGTIEEINLEKGRIRIGVEIFGRSTPVELDFLQVERL